VYKIPTGDLNVTSQTVNKEVFTPETTKSQSPSRHRENPFLFHQLYRIDMSDTASYNKSVLSTAIASRPDTELETKVKRASERICENLHIVANEPSLAFYRISEHVRKALPPTVESRAEVKRLNQQLQGAYFDAEYGLQSVKAMDQASPHLNNIQELLKNAIFIQQQLKYEQSRRHKREPSMYQRFSAHINSVDLPDLTDIRETARETANKVETVIQTASNTGRATQGGRQADKTIPRPKSEAVSISGGGHLARSFSTHK
jgi:hypothetical protein